MEHAPVPSSPVSQQSQSKTGRRKLQKCDPKTKSQKMKRGSADSSNSLHNGTGDVSPQKRQIQNGAPDLSDAKWQDYLRPDTIVSRDIPDITEQPQELEAITEMRPINSPLPRLIPELSLHDLKPQQSVDGSTIPSPTSSTSTSSTMGRLKARAPLFRLGIMEKPKAVLGRGAGGGIGDRACSVDLIAGQYQALLESKENLEEEEDSEGNESGYVDSWMQTESSHSDDIDSRYTARPQTTGSETSQFLSDTYTPSSPGSRNSRYSRASSRFSMAPQMNRDSQMPVFQDGAIYFKPVLYSPPPSPAPEPAPSVHLQTLHPSARNRDSTADNMSLQVCLDLMMKEMSSGITAHNRKHQTNAAAIQLMAMIESYERLRDQVMKMGLPRAQTQKLVLVFDSWLSALYILHTSLVDGALPQELPLGLEEEVD